jgi:hypothetical protein
MCLRLLTLVLALTLAVCAPASADRPDSDAPPGASSMWLPEEEWVMERWIPFDIERLEGELRVDRHGIYRYLRNGDPTIADLARAKGVRVTGLPERLLASRAAAVTPEQYASLLERTRRFVDQGHLAEHVIGHTFHNWSLMRQTQRVFGMSEQRRARLYQERRTPAEMAARAGVTRRRLRQTVLAIVRRSGERGVAQGALSEHAARDLWEHQVEAIEPWMDLRPTDGVTSLRARAAKRTAAPYLCALPRAGR